MIKKISLIIILCFLINSLILAQSEYKRKKTQKSKPVQTKYETIHLPLKLKWGMNPAQVKKVLKINKLNFVKSGWAKFIKKNYRYWLYFGKNKKALIQISMYFKTNNAFANFMHKFKRKFSSLRKKANLYKDSRTTVSIQPTIKPLVVFLKR